MFGELVSKATSSLPVIPNFLSTEDVSGRVRSVIPEVPTLPSTEELTGAVRRVGERVLDSVDNNIIGGQTLTRGVEYCGDAASNLPFIGPSIRSFVPKRQNGDCKTKEVEGTSDEEESNHVKYRRRRVRPNKLSQQETVAEQSGWRLFQTPSNPVTSASSLLCALLPNHESFGRLSSALTQIAFQTSMSASALTFSAANNIFKEYDTNHVRSISKNRSVMYARERSVFEAAQYILKFAYENIAKLCTCSPGELIRALAMFGALQKVLGTPYPPDEEAFPIWSKEGRSEFLTLRRLYDFAVASYGPLILDILRMNLTTRSMNELIVRLTGVCNGDILISNSTSKFQQPAFALVMDHKWKRIVVTIRGTANIEDGLTDVHAESAPFHVGYVHRGMLCSAQFLDRELRKIVTSKSKSYPEYEIILTGHSLGGAVSTVLAIMWHHDSAIGPKVRAVSFAAASGFSESLADDCKAFVTSVVYADDLISRLSLRAVENLCHILVMMCSEEGKKRCVDSNSISSLIEHYITAERSAADRWYGHLSSAYEVLTSSAAKHHSIHHLMYPGGKIRYVIPEADYEQHPERRPSHHNSNLIPENMYMLSGKSLKGLGEIVCNPAICLRHFPTVLHDFFRPRNTDTMKLSSSEETDEDFFAAREKSLSVETYCSDSEDDEKTSMEQGSVVNFRRNRSKSMSMLTPRRRSLQNIFCIRESSV